jgi:hypothetical protein
LRVNKSRTNRGLAASFSKNALRSRGSAANLAQAQGARAADIVRDGACDRAVFAKARAANACRGMHA